MPYFDAKDRTVFSPVNDKLEPLFKFLEQHQKSLSGSNFYDDLVELYEYLDQVLKEPKILDVSTLKENDIVRYYNFDNGKFLIDEGIVKSDNIYKDGIEVHGDGWKQYVGKWFISEVIRNNQTIYKQEEK
ncbi:hypothetical protein [Niallia sp. FSL R7-0271]|uniref:hypothetical protein n=1 Tax=Niallia sp. FSL R7-0271 TaxID=2921678 RepID=UPI0030F60DD2